MSFAHNYMLEYRKACEIFPVLERGGHSLQRMGKVECCMLGNRKACSTFPVLEKKGKCLQVLSDIALSDTGQRNVF